MGQLTPAGPPISIINDLCRRISLKYIRMSPYVELILSARLATGTPGPAAMSSPLGPLAAIRGRFGAGREMEGG